MNFLLQAFSEANGSPSSMRVLTGIVVVGIMAGWLVVTCRTHAMAPLPLDGSGAILLGALGIKAFQKGKERRNDPGSDTAIIQKQP